MVDATEEPIHNRLPVLRAEWGLTRQQFAEAIGVHYQTVGYLERGEYSPSLALAFRIARFFELPIEAVFSDQPFDRLSAQVYDPARSTTQPAKGQAPSTTREQV